MHETVEVKGAVSVPSTGGNVQIRRDKRFESEILHFQNDQRLKTSKDE